jgi:hypothetical protein
VNGPIRYAFAHGPKVTDPAEFRLPNIERFVNTVLNPRHSKSPEEMRRYRQFHALVIYFEYAAGMVIVQERALQKRDPDAIIVGSAIAAILFIYDAWELIGEALQGLAEAGRVRQLKRLSEKHLADLRPLRHLLAGHPAGTKDGQIARKRSGYASDGRVGIGTVWFHPRKELETLRHVAERMGASLLLR